MTSIVINLLVNILMAGLLAVTISYCWMLNRRIQILQDSKSELAQLLKHFDESTERASESIIALQTASKKIGEGIQTRIDKANYLLDDMAFMLEKGNKLVNQLEANAAVTRARNRAAEEPTAEFEMPAPPSMPSPDANGVSIKERTRASLEAVLEKVAARTKSPSWTPGTSKETPASPVRSRSEQELISILKAGLKG